MMGDSEFVQTFGLMQRTRGDRKNTNTGNIFQKMFYDEKGNGTNEAVLRTVHIKGRKENNRGFDSGEG